MSNDELAGQDAMERLVWDAEISAVVLGRAGQFVLVPLEQSPIAEVLKAEARERGFQFCGVVALKDSLCFAECERDPSVADTMLHAAMAFGQQVATKLNGESVSWLERLYQLPDTRQ